MSGGGIKGGADAGLFVREVRGGVTASLISALAELGNLPKEAKAPIGGALLECVTEGFEDERDPYGRRWKKPIGRDGQALSDTGRLKNSWRSAVTGSGVKLINATKYAAIHQFGGTILPKKGKALRFKLGKAWVTVKKVTMPQRMMVPGSGPSKKWEEAVDEEVRALIADVMDGGSAGGGE